MGCLSILKTKGKEIDFTVSSQTLEKENLVAVFFWSISKLSMIHDIKHWNQHSDLDLHVFLPHKNWNHIPFVNESPVEIIGIHTLSQLLEPSFI